MSLFTALAVLLCLTGLGYLSLKLSLDLPIPDQAIQAIKEGNDAIREGVAIFFLFSLAIHAYPVGLFREIGAIPGGRVFFFAPLAGGLLSLLEWYGGVALWLTLTPPGVGFAAQWVACFGLERQLWQQSRLSGAGAQKSASG